MIISYYDIYYDTERKKLAVLIIYIPDFEVQLKLVRPFLDSKIERIRANRLGYARSSDAAR
jgi:hypothetical protein